MKRTVSVIIPTTAVAARATGLSRAIRSVLAQDGADVLPIVVVNGVRFDQAVVDALFADRSLRVVQIREGNVSRARHAGLRRSDRDFFCFLDDDDELMPGSVRGRLDCFRPDDDVVVANGYYSAGGVDTVVVPAAVTKLIDEDPLGSFMEFNWLSSPSPMFRARSVPVALFDFDFRFFECTWIALSLIDRGKKLRYADCIAYRVHQNTAVSATKTKDYYRAYPAFLRRLREFRNFGDDFDAALTMRMIKTLNMLSQLELEWGHYGRAWGAHLLCLSAGGFAYLPYTRRLLYRQSS